MVFCSGCNGCFHERCGGVEPGSLPAGDWFCGSCSAWAATLRARRAPVVNATEPTYEVARRPQLDKTVRRREAGLESNVEIPTAAEVANFKRAYVNANTRKTRDGVVRRFFEFADQAGVDVRSTEAIEYFLTWRVKSGVAASTILLGDLSHLKKSGEVVLPRQEELDRLIAAVERLADCGGEAKDPITPQEMVRLKSQLVGPSWRDDKSETSHRSLHNWAFSLLAYVGMFRAGELVALCWKDVLLGWRRQGEKQTTDLSFDQRPAGAELVHASIYVLKQV